MNSDDFQNKFLKIGYSKRKKGNYQTESGRPYIGRKGIGKLALLSCANRIQIASRKNNEEIVGGTIDNAGLDEAIKDDLNSQDYILGELSPNVSEEIVKLQHGTLILFENVNDGIFNTIEYIKKVVALYFRFALIDKDFCIYINDEKIAETLLAEFFCNTQFLWKINGISDPFVNAMTEIKEFSTIESALPIRGYIASVNKPSQIKIRGTQEKLTIDLFVNGRLREKDILRHIPTARIVENYVYGQIHYDVLDNGDGKDVFTSSREGVISDDPSYKVFLTEIEKVFKNIMDDWDRLRRKYGEDGDPDNTSIPKKKRKAQELFNSTVAEFSDDKNSFAVKGGAIEKWINELSEEAQFNIPSYTECFIAENLLRRYSDHIVLTITPEAQAEAENWSSRELKNKEKANISYDIRQNQTPIYYLDMTALSNWIDKVNKTEEAGLSRSAIIYKPMRDAVGHTSLLTDIAKSQLSLVFENIKSRLIKLLKEFEENKNE